RDRGKVLHARTHPQMRLLVFARYTLSREMMDVRDMYKSGRIRLACRNLTRLPVEPSLSIQFSYATDQPVIPRARLGRRESQNQVRSLMKRMDQNCLVMRRTKLGLQRALRRVFTPAEIER